MIERLLEKFLFLSRWLLAPLYVGLVIALVALLVTAAHHLWELVAHMFQSTEAEMILSILGLIDMTLMGGLVIIVIFSGYENFVSRIDAADHPDWPEWMAKIDFTGLKLKLMSSIVAISGIQLLRAFMNIGNMSDRDLMWSVIIHVVFVASGLFLALTDRISGEAHAAKETGH
jgi:uncharacterized protein (TIGR00645 family)